MTGTDVLVAVVFTTICALVGRRLYVYFDQHNHKQEPETVDGVIVDDATSEMATATYFMFGWHQQALPVAGIVAVIDNGKPGVGLSAMQMNTLGVGRGLVRLEFKGRTCEAKVWNAYGPDSLKGAAEIRITNSVARALGCGIDDKINFVEVITVNLPVRVH